MPKLPVFATVGRAYSFVFRNLGLLYRLCWLPVLIFALPELVSFDLTDASQGLNPLLLALGVAIAMIVFLVQYFFLSMALVAIHRIILFGDRRPGTFFLFSVGRAEFYFTAVPLAIQLGAIGIVLLAISVFGWPTGLAGKLDSAIGLPLFLAFFVAWALGIWVACRFVPFYPMVVVTERLAIREAWLLSRGNFWRILGVLLFGSLPLFVVGMILVSVAAVYLTPQLLVQTQGPASIVIQIALNFVVGIPSLALGVAFLCYTFKALAGYAPDEVLTPPSD